MSSRDKFLGVWPRIKDELVEHLRAQSMPKPALEWYERNLDYNTPGGKLNRGVSVVDTLRVLKGRDLTDDEYFKAATLGWCIELLQAYFLVADDMMDQSVTRRGQPCWYRADGVGNIAINDAFMLEAAIYFLLKRHFRSEPSYIHLVELFLETTFQTEMGQLIDLITAPEDSVDLSKFSLEKHHLIVVYKTAYYSFYLPVAAAMRLHGLTSPSDPGAAPAAAGSATDPYQTALDILIPLGEYFQIQDDYLDCYADSETLGKIGTDILDNKCSWNINVALKHATPEQRAVLDANYGRKSSESEAKVKAVYNAPNIDVAGRYHAYEADVYQRLNSLIDAVPEQETGLKRDVFRHFLAKIHKRSK